MLKILHHLLFFIFILRTGHKTYVFSQKRVLIKGTSEIWVSQGSVLGQLLFSIFTNGLPLHISNGKVSDDLFAVDSYFHTREKHIQLVETSLQRSLNEDADWCDTNSIIIHPTKTKRLASATRQKHHQFPSVQTHSRKDRH